MRKIVVIALLVMLVFSASGVTAKPAEKVYCPSPWATTMDVSQNVYELAESVPTVDQATMESLPLITPFWKDLTDCENIPNDGEGVYIAVLDTGLIGAWANFLPEDQIATELGMGFSHDVAWDPLEEDFVWSDVTSDRGYLTKSYGSGHGTHVTSTITGFQLVSSMWVDGVAPKATIIPVLVLDYWWLSCPDPDYYNPEWDAA